MSKRRLSRGRNLALAVALATAVGTLSGCATRGLSSLAGGVIGAKIYDKMHEGNAENSEENERTAVAGPWRSGKIQKCSNEYFFLYDADKWPDFNKDCIPQLDEVARVADDQFKDGTTVGVFLECTDKAKSHFEVYLNDEKIIRGKIVSRADYFGFSLDPNEYRQNGDVNDVRLILDGKPWYSAQFVIGEKTQISNAR